MVGVVGEEGAVGDWDGVTVWHVLSAVSTLVLPLLVWVGRGVMQRIDGLQARAEKLADALNVVVAEQSRATAKLEAMEGWLKGVAGDGGGRIGEFEARLSAMGERIARIEAA